MSNAVNRRRVKIGATIDAELAAAVDDFVASDPTVDRSGVLDDALRLWYARRQSEAMRAQYAASASPEEQRERGAWRRIRRAAATRTFRRP